MADEKDLKFFSDKNDKNLLAVLEKCTKYVGDKEYVYGVCCGNNFDLLFSQEENPKDQKMEIEKPDSKEKKVDEDKEEWMLVMKKTKTTKIYDDRENIANETYAKFKEIQLKIVEMFRIDNPNITKIKPNEFGKDINILISNLNGVEYFMSPLRAYYQRRIPKQHTGHWMSWFDDGHRNIESEYLNGIPVGRWVHWCRGRKMFEYEYVNKNKTLYWTNYHENGKKESEGNRINGMSGERVGYWIEYRENGKKLAEGEYENGFRTGEWINYDDNEQELFISSYEKFSDVVK